MKGAIYRPVLFAAFLAWAGPLPAQTLITIRDFSGTITAIDTSTLTASTVGTLSGTVPPFSFGDLAAVNSQIYMIPGRGNDNLYTLNPTTGVATLVGAHGIGDLFAMAYDSVNNTLYAATFSTPYNLYTLSLSTGAATLVGPTGVSLGSMAFDTQTGQLIGVSDGPGTIYQVNTLTGALTQLATPGGTNDSGLVYDPIRNVFWDADASGNLYQYDPTHGFSRTQLLTNLGENDGLVFIGVPEPPVAGLMACGLAVIGLARLPLGSARRRLSFACAITRAAIQARARRTFN